MGFKCCIPGCGDNSERKDVILHRMPAAISKNNIWQRSIPFKIFEGLTTNEIGKLFVCHEHFEAKFMVSKFLTANAYPTLFTRAEIASGKPANVSAETGMDLYL